jgi:2-iminobutanoate/2-iminopropanoate deaminase
VRSFVRCALIERVATSREAANAAGLSLKDAVRVGVFLRNPADAKEFDAIYREYVAEPFPVRTLTQSNFAGFDIEVDAVLARR